MAVVIAQVTAFTISDADIVAGDESVVYECTGAFSITIPATGIAVGSMFVIMSIDGLQTFTETGTVTPPQGRGVSLFAANSSVLITCLAVGDYKIDGDLTITSITEVECSFSANLAGVDDTTTIVAPTAVKVPLSNTDYNYGSNFDTATSKFTAPEPGRYFFSFSVGIPTLTSTATDFTALLYKDSALVKTGNRNAVTGSLNSTSSGVDILDLVTGSVIELWVYQSESSSETIKGKINQTWLSGYKLVASPSASGATGSFLSGDTVQKTITVVNGIITTIV